MCGGGSGAEAAGGMTGGASADAGGDRRRFRIGTDGPAEPPGAGGAIGSGAPDPRNSSVKLAAGGGAGGRPVGGGSADFMTLDASSGLSAPPARTWPA